MILRMRSDEHSWCLHTNPLPWWDEDARWFLGLTALGEAGVETDEKGEPTGWRVYSHPDITVWEVWLLDVVRAGYAYAASLGPVDGPAVIAHQHATDWANWATLRARVENGEITRAEAVEIARAEAVRLAATLGVDPPDLGDDETAEEDDGGLVDDILDGVDDVVDDLLP